MLVSFFWQKERFGLDGLRCLGFRVLAGNNRKAEREATLARELCLAAILISFTMMAGSKINL